PWPVWLLAALPPVCMVAFGITVFAEWRGIGKILFFTGMSLFFSVWMLLIGYIYGDARRRGMRYVMWTLLAIFIPSSVGIILYFIMRDPVLRICPECGASARGGHVFCPSCGKPLAKICPACRRAVDVGWSHCAQ